MSERWPGGLINQTAPTFPYKGVWTLDQVAYLQGQGVWPYGPSDPYFYDVSLLLNGDGTNGAQNNTFLDSSTNNFTITRNGNTTQGSFSPYGNLWSSYSPAGGSYFTAPNNSAFDFGSGNFTIEGWINPPDSSQRNIVARDYTGGDGFILSSTNFLAAITTTWDVNITFSSGFTGGQWSHFAVVRNGNVWTCYINGVSVGTQTLSGSVIAGSDVLSIGNRNGQTPFAGYLSNFRIVKGTAVYTSAFTPPTTPLTAISGTSILTCQSNRFIDNSSNAFAITVNGSPSIQRFSPFNPTAPYDTATIGGSAYFGAATSENSLTLNLGSSCNFGTGNFTVEGWAYFDSGIPSGSNPYFIDNRTATSWAFSWNYNGGSNPYQLAWTDASGNVLQTSTTMLVGQWNHCVYVRNGSTGTIYLNGVSVASWTDTTNYSTNASSATIGRRYVYTFNQTLPGYMGDFRIVNGTAVYTSTFTPPTAPLTAISGTALLMSYTNAGIPDLAMQNNLQTVGSAQVSTSVKKYGTGSLYFPNSGSNYLSNYATPFVDLTNFGTGDFTIETWIYFNTLSINQGIVDNATNLSSAGTGKWTININSSNQLCFGQHSVGNIIQYSWSPSTGTWYYITVTRSNGTVRMFIDGNIVATASSSANFNSSGGIQVAATASYGTLQGYLDDMRITKGLARYTANFTPPTAALPTY